MNEKGIEWDLTEIFSGLNDPKISKTMDALMDKANEIIKNYKGIINKPNFTAQNFYELLEKYEEIYAGGEDLGVYSYNSYMVNTNLPETKALYNKYKDYESTISKKLAFLELEIGRLITEKPQIINDEPLSNYTHYLEKIKTKFPYKLSEKEEQLIIEKDQHGTKAWEQLRDSWISSRKFKATIEGKEKILSFMDFIDYQEHPSREIRISVNEAVYKALMQDEEIYASALRNICGNYVKTSKRRGLNNTIHQSLIDNDTTQEIISNLMKTVESNVGIYQKFLKSKSKLLDLPKLSGVDIFAYLPSVLKFTWDELKEINIQVYNKFDTSFGEIVIDIFERNHIDTCTREGKIAGYCSSWYNGKTSFISLSFNGLFNDVIPFIHELGHGIHNILAFREQSYFNCYPGMIVAETASTFGELLLTDYLLETTESTNEKVILLTNILNWAGNTIFGISVWFWFEQSLYDAIERGEYLDGNTISNYWCAARDKIFGNSVEWFDEMKYEWSTVPHFFMNFLRFYSYPYVYGQLFVYALYQSYKKEGERFVPKFKDLLSSGCSVSPVELGKIVGLDITTPEFWNIGMKQYEVFVDELEKLII